MTARHPAFLAWSEAMRVQLAFKIANPGEPVPAFVEQEIRRRERAMKREARHGNQPDFHSEAAGAGAQGAAEARAAASPDGCQDGADPGRRGASGRAAARGNHREAPASRRRGGVG